jgi:hypothetical protein
VVASPNFVRLVYDGDGDALGTTDPNGFGTVESVLNDYFASQGQGLETEPTVFDGRSDYEAFIVAGIPAGGLFSGAEEVKTAEEAAIYGGTAGVPYDECYHQVCDDTSNLNKASLDQLSDGVAHAALASLRKPPAAQLAGDEPRQHDHHSARERRKYLQRDERVPEQARVKAATSATSGGKST